jgi:hypothetical protein
MTKWASGKLYHSTRDLCHDILLGLTVMVDRSAIRADVMKNRTLAELDRWVRDGAVSEAIVVPRKLGE